MSTIVGLDRCYSFINCQLEPGNRPHEPAGPEERKCSITISRQSGCGARALSEKLAAYLQDRSPAGSVPWTIFDRNLVEKVLADHNLPGRISRYMPEDRVSEIADIMDELFGLRPSSWTLVQQTSETILHLAELGNVIILGRGANIITAKLPRVLHVRLVGSLKKRIEKMQFFEKLPEKEAAARVHQEDIGRERYVRKHFEKDVADPLLYHLVINTDLFGMDEMIHTIGDLALKLKVSRAA